MCSFLCLISLDEGMQAFILLRTLLSIVERCPSITLLSQANELWPHVLMLASQNVHNEDEVCSYTDTIDALRRLRLQECTSMANFDKEIEKFEAVKCSETGRARQLARQA